MFNIYTALSILLAISFTTLGVLAVVRNSKLWLNRAFALFSLSTSIWLVATYIGGDSSVNQQVALIANRLLFAFGVLSIISFWLFAYALTRKYIGLLERVVLATSVAAIVVSATNFVVQGVHIAHNTYTIDFGILAGPLIVLLVGVSLWAIIILWMARSHSEGRERSQIDTILRSFGVVLLAILVTNALIPFMTGSYALVNIGPLFTAALVWAMAHTIIRHRLFDVRLIIVRAMGYVTSLILLSVIYAALIFALLNFVFDLAIPLDAQVVIAILVAVASIGFQPLKRSFDKFSSNLFYQDAYDVRAILDKLNAIFISTVEIKELLTRTAKTVEDLMKVTACSVVIIDPKQGTYQVYTSSSRSKHQGMPIDTLRKLSKKQSVFIADYMDVSSLIAARAELSDASISVVARISEASQDLDGFLLLGPKKSGNSYTQQDEIFAGTLAKELSIGVQNALQFKKIQEFNMTLQEKVAEATRKMRTSNEKLRKLDETKDEFISMASHQLRTPLTSIKGYLSMVLEGDAGDITDVQRQMLNQAFVSSQRMVYLISDLLNLSRLNTGKFVIDATPVDLREIVTAEIDQLRETAKARDITVLYDNPAEFPTIMLDETKIHQVVMNFMDNAIYYTTAGGTVTISLAETPAAVEFRVKDSGIGVPRAEQRHLFSKFYRAPNARKVRPDGTGLGLFMSKKVVAAQNGAIIFESEEGKGSTFGFRFNKASHQPEHNSDEQ